MVGRRPRGGGERRPTRLLRLRLPALLLDGPPANWMGDDGFLTKMYVELRLFNVVGDTAWCRGKVIAKREEGDERLVDLEIWGENQRGAVTTKGTATIRLPFKQTTN